MNKSMEKSRKVGISLPEDIVYNLDTIRKDVSRSRYILRLVEEKINLRKTIGDDLA
jgi:metal-responsive CopG/Arc/MetJ family transcriptional regulator